MSYPGTFTRPTYPPPIPGFNADVGGADPVTHALRTQQAVHQQYSQWRADHSPHISPQVLKDSAGSYQVSDGALALAPALAGSKAAADAAAQRVADLVGGVRPDADVASQLASTAFWNRKRAVLDNVKDPARLMDAVRNLIKTATPEEVPVLNVELPDYLSSRGARSTDWLKGAIAERIPGYAEAQAAATLAARQHAVIATNHADLTRSIQHDTNPPPLLDPFAPAINSTPYTGGEVSSNGGASGGE